MAAKSITEYTEQDLIAIVKLGNDAQNFLLGDGFFKNHLVPKLQEKREQAKRDADWNPGKTTDNNEIALYTVYNSGKRAGLADIHTCCHDFIVNGERAAKEMERRKKKEEQKANGGSK